MIHVAQEVEKKRPRRAGQMSPALDDAQAQFLQNQPGGQPSTGKLIQRYLVGGQSGIGIPS